MVRTITDENFGAWLIKCDPETRFDLPGLIEDGGEVITSWSVVRNYRSDLMAAGDKIILWVSGSGRRMARGVWGLGHVIGPVEDAVPADEDAEELHYWHDAEARQAVGLFAPVDIPLFTDAVAAEELLAAGITDLEVQRMPQGSNPSWVSKQQLAHLSQLLPPWPGEPPTEEHITITPKGAGFGDPASNAVVEAAAMAAVIDYYHEWTYQDVSRDKVGWDITFRHPQTGESALVEVKGVSSARPTVLLTANELKAARTRVDWYLAVVTRALSDPIVLEYSAEEALAAAIPYVYKAALPEPG